MSSILTVNVPNYKHEFESFVRPCVVCNPHTPDFVIFKIMERIYYNKRTVVVAVQLRKYKIVCYYINSFFSFFFLTRLRPGYPIKTYTCTRGTHDNDTYLHFFCVQLYIFRDNYTL